LVNLFAASHQNITSLKKRKAPFFSQGELIFLHLDIEDLSTVKASAEEFLKGENKLNVLWNNCGVIGSSAEKQVEKKLQAAAWNHKPHTILSRKAFDPNFSRKLPS
jgi:NADP-dependent 3-hydroxy acid dehydrogenase YdfG